MLYAYFASIISELFFPQFSANIALLNTFSIFALGYLARPIGGFMFGRLQDKYGRKRVFSTSLLLMTFATFLLGCLPTYAQIGALAPVFLIVARLLQGFSASGEFCAAIIFIYEHMDDPRQRWLCITPFFGLCLGMLIGSLISLAVIQHFSANELLAYAWRIPFWLSLISGLVGYYVRTRTPETPVFLQNQKNKMNEIKPQWRKNIRGILFTLCTSLFSASAFYLLFIFAPSRLHLANYSLSAAIKMTAFGLIVYLFTLPITAYLANRAASKKLFYFFLIALIFSAIPLFSLVLQPSNFSLLAFLLLCFLSAALVAPFAQWWAASFPSHHRASYFSFIYNLSNTLVGGTIPLVSTYLLTRGFYNGPGVILSCTGIICLLGILIFSENKQE